MVGSIILLLLTFVNLAFLDITTFFVSLKFLGKLLKCLFYLWPFSIHLLLSNNNGGDSLEIHSVRVKLLLLIICTVLFPFSESFLNVVLDKVSHLSLQSGFLIISVLIALKPFIKTRYGFVLVVNFVFWLLCCFSIHADFIVHVVHQRTNNLE